MGDDQRPVPSAVRFRVDPGDVPAEKAARRLHLSVAQFNEVLPRLQARGFPKADPDTGMFDLDEIDRWRARRHGPAGAAAAPPAEPELSMGERFLIAMRAKEEVRQKLRRRKVKPGKHEPPP